MEDRAGPGGPRTPGHPPPRGLPAGAPRTIRCIVNRCHCCGAARQPEAAEPCRNVHARLPEAFNAAMSPYFNSSPCANTRWGLLRPRASIRLGTPTYPRDPQIDRLAGAKLLATAPASCLVDQPQPQPVIGRRRRTIGVRRDASREEPRAVTVRGISPPRPHPSKILLTR